MLLRLFNFFAINFNLVNYWFPASSGPPSASSAPKDSTAPPAPEENRTASLLLGMFSFILFGGILCAPLSGVLIDTLRLRFSRAVAGESEDAVRVRERLARVREGAVVFNYNDLYSTVPPLTIATLLCLIVSVLVFVPAASSLGIAYVVFTCFRAFLFSTINSYMYVPIYFECQQHLTPMRH